MNCYEPSRKSTTGGRSQCSIETNNRHAMQNMAVSVKTRDRDCGSQSLIFFEQDC